MRPEGDAATGGATNAPSDLTGRTISHYRILEKLGRGGMGVVYKAEDLRLRRFVALKFLYDDVVSNADAIGRFQREAALAFGLSGDSTNARRLADDLAGRFPEDTQVKFSSVPVLRAVLALNNHDASAAIDVLQPAAVYELGWMCCSAGFTGSLYPIYVRGLAYLAERKGAEASAEFQKILDHRGIVIADPIGALARLQIGRAYALGGNSAKAKTAYQDFLTLWNDADADIPVLRDAKAEYSKL